MKPIKNNRPVVVGIFIFLGLAIFLAGVFTLGGQKKSFAKSITVKAVFNDVSGLQSGSNIWYAGVKIGTVQKVTITGDARVEVTMHILKTQTGFVRKDARAKIGSEGLIGNKLIIIAGGTEQAGPVNEGDQLQTDMALSTDDIMSTLQQNNKNLLAITGTFKNISKQIEDGKGTLGQLLRDSTMIMSIRSSLANFKQASSTANMAVAHLNEYTTQFHNKGTLLNELVTDTTTYAILQNTATQLRAAASNADDFTNNLYYLSETMKHSNNSLGVLLRDTAAANNLRSTIYNLRTSSEKLDEDLEAAQHNFLLRGYFRKKEKAEEKERKKQGQQ
ncbi:MlaD family protein [Deminuibacter soli]|uniref:MCE family protein n=1 Tax=Deminuibacter soli TaxID=2291815 RepID=A0A3E1NNM2_9BACT|nr:MlaD family protein [Deminuibacter soli]RFM29529.1 MCE family protein [Deminuibacter soli]